MKNKGFGVIAIIIIVGAIVILGGGAYFLTTNKNLSPETEKNIEELEQKDSKIEELSKEEEKEKQEEQQVEESKEEEIVVEEPSELIETSFSSPYLVSWVEGPVLLSLTEASLGTISAPRGIRKFSGFGNYNEGEKIHALTLYFKIKTGDDYYSVPLRIRRETNEEADLIKPNTQQFMFPDSGGMQASPETIYTNQKIIFVVPETEKEFYFTISDFYFSITAEGNQLKLKRENRETHRHTVYGFNLEYPEFWFKEVCSRFGEDRIIFDPTKVGAKSGCDCETYKDCYYGAIAVNAYAKGWTDLNTLIKPHLVKGFVKHPVIVGGQEGVKLLKEDSPSEVYVYVERSNYVLELAYRDIYGLEHLRTFNRMVANLSFSY